MTSAAVRKDALRTPKLWWVAAVFAVAIALYSWRYPILGERAYVPELAVSFRTRPWAILVHTLFGPLALLGGTIQFLPSIRQPGRWGIHRLVGRIYVVAAIVLATAGLFLSFYSYGGIVTHAGFGALAVATLLATGRGYLLIRARKVSAHRQWMLRSYSLIFAAVTLRVWIPLLMIATKGEYLTSYRIVAWLAWIPNILVAEWVIRRGWNPFYRVDTDSPKSLAGS